MVARYDFTERMADYILLRTAKDNSECYALAIIGRATGSYSREYTRGNSLTGLKRWFYDHVIHNKQEALYQQPDCLMSQLLHAVWLYEHQRQFSSGELQDKYLNILKNIISFGFSGDQHLCLLLFVEKFALGSFPERQTFSKFVKQVNKLTQKIDNMTSIEHIKELGREEGLLEGREEGREEREILTNKFIKTLLKSSSHSVQEIAEITESTVEKVEAIKAAL